MIPDFKTYIEEGVWTRGIRRSSDEETVRGEDVVDTLDMNGFVEYLNNHYQYTGKGNYSISHKTDYPWCVIDIPVKLVYDVFVYYSTLMISYDKATEDVINEISITTAMDVYPKVKEILRKKYPVKVKNQGTSLSLGKKDMEITKSVCLDFLNTMIDNMEDTLITRK